MRAGEGGGEVVLWSRGEAEARVSSGARDTTTNRRRAANRGFDEMDGAGPIYDIAECRQDSAVGADRERQSSRIDFRLPLNVTKILPQHVDS